LSGTIAGANCSSRKTEKTALAGDTAAGSMLSIGNWRIVGRFTVTHWFGCMAVTLEPTRLAVAPETEEKEMANQHDPGKKKN